MPSRPSRLTSHEIVLCDRSSQFEQQVETFASELGRDAHTVGSHGLSQAAFDQSGIFRAAIERLRGQFSATTSDKYAFIRAILDHLKTHGRIADFHSTGGANRHDFEVTMPNGRIVVIEAKGCLDGNNTNIYTRPQHAQEFIIWSYCQNPGASPRGNVWSGIHVRLSAEIITRQADALVDGLIVWDALCGTAARPCPKLTANATRMTTIAGLQLPPPCIYLFRTDRSAPEEQSGPAAAQAERRDVPARAARRIPRRRQRSDGRTHRVPLSRQQRGTTDEARPR